MAKKSGNKGSPLNDSSYHGGMPGETKTENEYKSKVNKLHEIFPSMPKHRIREVLEFCKWDEDEAIDSLTVDGGQKALDSWTVQSNKSKTNKNKRRNKKKDKVSQGNSSTAASIEADDNSSIHSNNVDQEGEKDYILKSEIDGNDVLLQEQQESREENEAPSNETDVFPVFIGNKENHVDKHEVVIAAKSDSLQEVGFDSYSEAFNPKENKIENFSQDVREMCKSAPVEDYKEPKQKEEKVFHSKEDSNSPARTSRQRTGSFHRSKTPSFSDDHGSSILQSSQVASAPIRRAFEKCKKDLNKQSISLQRIGGLLEKGLERSSHCLKDAFSDIREMLNKRQAQMEKEMEKVNEDAMNLLKQRKELAADLKRRVDRSHSLSESDWNELKGDIKQFVVERKYDEELRKTVWFCWSVDHISEEINKFGEVIPVKNSYSQRLQSMLTSHSASNSRDDPVQSGIEMSTEESAPSAVLSSVEIPVPEKAISQNKINSQSSRVFSNKRYNMSNYPGRYQHYNNRGRGGSGRFRGGYGSHFNRPRVYENFHHGDYRYHSGSEQRPNVFRPNKDKVQDNYQQNPTENSIKGDKVNASDVESHNSEGHNFMRHRDQGQFLKRGHQPMNPFRGSHQYTRTEKPSDNVNGKEIGGNQMSDINGFASP